MTIEGLFTIRLMIYHVSVGMYGIMNMSNIAFLLASIVSLVVVGSAFRKGKCA